MISISELAIVGDVASIGLLFGIFYRMGVFTSNIESIKTRLHRLEAQGKI